MADKAIVIGSGIAGLATSIRLAQHGLETHVFEANSFPGGKINSRTINGYRFDQGPSLLTCPEYIEELYKLCGKDFTEFEMVDLPTSFKYFFNDGTEIELTQNRSQIVQELAEKLGENKKNVEQYLQKAKKNYTLISPLFIEKSLHRWRGLFGKKLVKALSHLPSYKLMSTMHQENARYFKNPRTIQVFNRFAQYNGSHPYKAPAMLNMISHLEINIPPYLPKKGMIQITEALCKLAEESGVQFHFNDRVEEILIEDSKVTGVRTTSGIHSGKFVVSNMDISFSYEKLMPTQKRPKKILSQEKSSSVVAFYWGMKKKFDKLHIHNMLFSDEDKEEFDAVFLDKKMHHSPSIYLYISSKAVESDAPKDCENWFLLINAPINQGQDWDAIVNRMREYTIKRMSTLLNEDIQPYIELEEILDPRVIEEKYSGKFGSIYGNASNNRFAAFYRHPNYSKHVKGLYFAGVSVHPGGGIPLAMNSAKIACKCLFDDYGIPQKK